MVTVALPLSAGNAIMEVSLRSFLKIIRYLLVRWLFSLWLVTNAHLRVNQRLAKRISEVSVYRKLRSNNTTGGNQPIHLPTLPGSVTRVKRKQAESTVFTQQGPITRATANCVRQFGWIPTTHLRSLTSNLDNYLCSDWNIGKINNKNK